MDLEINRGLTLKLFLIVLFSILPLASVVSGVINGKWNIVVASTFVILCNFLPLYISHILYRYDITLSKWFYAAYLILISTSMFLGPVYKFYSMFWSWDIFVHTYAGIILSFLGFYIIDILNGKDIIYTLKSPFVALMFSFFLSITCTALWELFEYLSDLLLGTNLMSFDLGDTMSDILVGTLGAVAASFSVYWVKKKL